VRRVVFNPYSSGRGSGEPAKVEGRYKEIGKTLGPIGVVE
jgi:hypothetical protein